MNYKSVPQVDDMIVRGIAAGALELRFGKEAIDLDGDQWSAIVTDFIEGNVEDGLQVADYQDAIGVGNLASYADTLIANQRLRIARMKR